MMNPNDPRPDSYASELALYGEWEATRYSNMRAGEAVFERHVAAHRAERTRRYDDAERTGNWEEATAWWDGIVDEAVRLRDAEEK